MSNVVLPSNIKHLFDEGCQLSDRIMDFLDKWPLKDGEEGIYWDDTSETHMAAAYELTIETRRWFNSVNMEVIPYSLYNSQYLYYLLRQVEAAIRKHKYERPYPETQVKAVRMTEHPFLVDRGGHKTDIDYETTLEEAKTEAREGMSIALSLIESVPSAAFIKQPSRQQQYSNCVPNTAFILMWMHYCPVVN